MSIKTWWKQQNDQTKGRVILVGAGVGLVAVGAVAAVALKVRSGDAHEAAKDISNVVKGNFYRNIEPSDKPYNIALTKVVDGKVRLVAATKALDVDEIHDAMKDFVDAMDARNLENGFWTTNIRTINVKK